MMLKSIFIYLVIIIDFSVFAVKKNFPVGGTDPEQLSLVP